MTWKTEGKRESGVTWLRLHISRGVGEERRANWIKLNSLKIEHEGVITRRGPKIENVNKAVY